ncbi:MAG TPA: hypothetical protein VIA06_24950 [Candidatus Dormibacteraeota bacterium]|jgi:hypothetical protein|nr:hypothetical protein [Candidatus Dormibacteraeota bacterium]
MATTCESYQRHQMWNRDVFDGSGNHLGRVEAVGISRDRTLRRIGVRARGTERALRFISVTQLTDDGERLIFDPVVQG